MNYTEYLQSLKDPLYEADGIPKCPEGYRFDVKTMRCVPKTKKDAVSDDEGKGTPDTMTGFDVWGSNGMDGGYALATEGYKEFPIDRVIKQIKKKEGKGEDTEGMKSVARDEGHGDKIKDKPSVNPNTKYTRTK